MVESIRYVVRIVYHGDCSGPVEGSLDRQATISTIALQFTPSNCLYHVLEDDSDPVVVLSAIKTRPRWSKSTCSDTLLNVLVRKHRSEGVVTHREEGRGTGAEGAVHWSCWEGSSWS